MCGPYSVSRLLILSSLLLAISVSLPSLAQTTLRQQIDTLTAATSLDRDGIQPWHMRLSFDLLDLKGQPQESGTIEEWWAGPNRARVVIKSPSLNEILPGTRATDGRKAYLVDLLLKETVHPMPGLKYLDGFDITAGPKNFGQKALSCISLDYKNDGGPSNELCTDPENEALRILIFGGIRSHALNELDTFGSTQIAKSHTIAYLGHAAIKGHIESIEPFDPDHSTLELGPIASSQDGVSPPRLLTRITPIYPMQARESDQSGFAVLHFHILPNGKVSPIDIIASTSSAFTDASTEAVRRWSYTSAKRNGTPLECDATLTLTFTPPSKNQKSFNVLMHEDQFAE
jgi:TonB family protein